MEASRANEPGLQTLPECGARAASARRPVCRACHISRCSCSRLRHLASHERQPVSPLIRRKTMASATQPAGPEPALRPIGIAELRSQLAAFVRELIATQGMDGYLGPFPRAKRLVGPGLWDVWGHYHCLLGLLLWHVETGDTDALTACRRIGDLLCRTFLDGDQ